MDDHCDDGPRPWAMCSGYRERADGTLVRWRGFYDECGGIVCDDDRRGPEPLYGWDEDDDE